MQFVMLSLLFIGFPACTNYMCIIWNTGIEHIKIKYTLDDNTIIYFPCVQRGCVIAPLVSMYNFKHYKLKFSGFRCPMRNVKG